MNLAEFRTRIARVSGLSTTVAADYTLMDGWVNDAVVQFVKETKMNTRMAALALTAGQANYTLDDDILAMQALWYEPSASSQKFILEPVAPETMFEMRIPAAPAGASTKYYALSGAHILMLHPAPASSDDQLHALYVPRPAAMSTTADTPSASANGNIPEEYHVLLEAYAKWKAGEAEEHRASDNGLQFQAEWERGVARIRGELARKAGQVMPSVRLGRPRSMPVGNGVDIGR